VVVGEHLLEDRITGRGEGAGGSLTIAVQPRAGTAAAPLGPGVAALARRVAGVPDVGPPVVEPLGTALLLHVPLEVAPESSAAVDGVVPAVRRAAVADASLTRVAEVDVGGLAAFQADLDDEIVGNLWLVALALLGLAYLILLVLLRSVLLPLKAVLLNLFSIGAAYGVLIAVFQWGWLDWLGYESLGVITPLTLPLIMTITFGLSMDYEVFLLARIKERYELHGDNARAVAEGLESSARVITSAAAIMVAVFGAFVLTGVPAIKEIGLGLAVAILIDATVTRLVLVPASMRLLGGWNWWLPAWLDRRLPHVAHRGAQRASARRAGAPAGSPPN
jgi:RND superfamily putative drug exporter